MNNQVKEGDVEAFQESIKESEREKPKVLSGTAAMSTSEKQGEFSTEGFSFGRMDLSRGALMRLAMETEGKTAEYKLLGATTIASQLTDFAWRLAVVGTPFLREQVSRKWGGNQEIEPILAADDKTRLVFKPSGEASDKGVFSDYYTQIVREARQWLKEDASDPSTAQTLRVACKYAVLMAYGWAQFALYPANKSGRLPRDVAGEPWDGKEATRKGRLIGVSVKASVLRPVTYQTTELPGGEGKETRVPNSGKPNKEETLFPLSAKVADALYAIKILGVEPNDKWYDAWGWLVERPMERNPATPEVPESVKRVGELLASAAEFGGPNNAITQAFLTISKKLNEDDKMPVVGQGVVGACEMMDSLLSRLVVGIEGTGELPSYDVCHAIAMLGESIAQTFSLRDEGNKILVYGFKDKETGKMIEKRNARTVAKPTELVEEKKDTKAA